MDEEVTLDEAIAHFDAVAECCRDKGEPQPTYACFARYLKRLRVYEAAIASGELVWKKERKKK